ncbi:MAG: hydroxymethylbilane synthase [Desulfovibrionales bacterium]|jgi:hydroxymethylbilane synthase|nr:hydroxymethylbilane synthase [Desulfovibrionales bacterium]
MRNHLTIATRGSKLALWQAEHIAGRLKDRYAGLEVGLLKITTQGDKILDVPLAKVGGKGLFVKEIEEALLDGRADIAVHSMKDVPTELPEGLIVDTIPAREVRTDSLLSCAYDGLEGLPQGAKVGTSSLRRKAQLLALRSDLDVRDLRGNLDTRLRKLEEGAYDAIVVATAGLLRLGLKAPKQRELAPPEFLPAVAQGALGVERRYEDAEAAEMLAFLHDERTGAEVAAERGFLARLEGGCQVPIAAFAEMAGSELSLTGLVADVRGERMIRRAQTGPAADAGRIGKLAADKILAAGGADILAELYGEAPGA